MILCTCCYAPKSVTTSPRNRFSVMKETFVRGTTSGQWESVWSRTSNFEGRQRKQNLIRKGSHMITRRIRMLVAGTLIAICCKTVSGQGSSSVILNVNTENSVVYLDDVSDVSRFATNLNVTAAVVARNFQQSIVMEDIVSVNGQSAKVEALFSIRANKQSTAPT